MKRRSNVCGEWSKSGIFDRAGAWGQGSEDHSSGKGKPVKYRKKPVVIEAVQFSGENRREVLSFVYPNLSEDALSGAEIMRLPVVIQTLEGDMTASPGDWIIKGVKGEFYPCKPDIFAASYDPAE